MESTQISDKKNSKLNLDFKDSKYATGRRKTSMISVSSMVLYGRSSMVLYGHSSMVLYGHGYGCLHARLRTTLPTCIFSSKRKIT